ncbi:MAG: hypothetical protein K8L97_21690 [Anaerolineae bacterium]|nr:hypothetical protein [Anaerolineae bacterium]
MKERSMMEARLLMWVSGENSYDLKPYQQATGKEKHDVQRGIWAEIALPYHPTDANEPIYSFLVFVVGKPQHEAALLEMTTLEANKEHIYQTFKAFAIPFFDWEWETPMG